MALIGIGCSPVLMASYYIFARSYSPARFATLAALTLGIGSVGNLIAAYPTAWAAETIGWRATLWVLGGHASDEYKGVAKFMTYLSSPAVQAWWHQETGYVPITTPAYELSKTQGFYDQNPGTDTAIKQLSLNTPTPYSRGLRFGNFVQIRDVINEEMEAVWNGSKNATDALDAAAKRGDALLRKFERTAVR